MKNFREIKYSLINEIYVKEYVKYTLEFFSVYIKNYIKILPI